MTAATDVAVLHTNFGDIRVNLFADHAPKTVRNFVGLADGTQEWIDPSTGKAGDGPLYSDVVFHRVIDGFMVQGGDPRHRHRRPVPIRRRVPSRAAVRPAVPARHGHAGPGTNGS